MISPYLFRLLSLSLASFFLLNAALSLLVRVFSQSALRFADRRTPSAAARLLLTLRLLPFVLATLFVLVLCVPSYLWLEPAVAAERIGVACVVLAFLGAATWCLSLTRAAQAVVASIRHNQLAAAAGKTTQLLGNPSEVVVVEQEAPLLAMSGLLRPRLLISRNLLNSLSPEALAAALSHEHAHRTSRDNGKRFLILLAPDIFPFIRPLKVLERNWSKFTEWAADDQAAAGDPFRALSLAAALVRVARMGSAPRLPYLATSLLACDRDLAARVDRLLHPSPLPRSHTSPARFPLRTASLLFASSLALLLLLAPPTLAVVHQLLELFLH
jgi:Zn-dependent protease with chaperone function